MNELTELQWVYTFELTAPVFYRVKRGYLKNEEDRSKFLHFEESELPHAPMIKEFLAQYGRGAFPWPKIFELAAAVLSHFVCLFGERAMYYFEYLFENKAVYVYTKLSSKTKDEKFKQITLKLLEEEIPHLEFFKMKLGKSKIAPVAEFQADTLEEAAQDVGEISD